MFDNTNESPTVKDVIKTACNEKMFLPEFQREYVWEKLQIKLLIDSLYNGYTINSILTWEGDDQLARRRVGGSIKEIVFPEAKGVKQVNYLLDGQQRTTSLVLVFTDKPVYKKKNIKKSENIDLLFDSEYTGDDPEERFIYADEPIEIENQEILLSSLSEDQIFEKFGTRFIKLKNVYRDYVDSNYFSEVETKYSDHAVKYYKKLRDLREKILDRKIVNITQKGDLHSVLNIFERINTLNTKLNIYDIMVAKTYKKIKNDYFDLRSYMKMINYEGSIKTDFFENKNNPDIDGIIEFNLDEETQLFLFLVILKKEFKQKKILDLDTETLILHMKKIHADYWRSINYLRNNFKVDMGDLRKFRPILKFLVATLSDKTETTVKEKEFLNKWFWSTLLYNRYPGAQNERVEKDYKLILEIGIEKSLEAYKKDRTRKFDDTSNFDAYYGSRSQLYDGISSLFLENSPRDFYYGVLVSKGMNLNSKLEEHHIFPINSDAGKSVINKYKKTDNENLINSIANIALITKETNNTKIHNRNPSDYITVFEKEYSEIGKLDEFKSIMESQFITEEMIEDLKINDFDSFISKRTKLIKKRIKHLCGDHPV